MKHLTITCLVALLSCFTTLSAQVKKTYQDQKHKHQTVVIKSSDTENDLEILKAQFDIDKFKVGEVVKITIEKPTPSSNDKAGTALVEGAGKRKLKRDKKKIYKYKGRSLGGKQKDKKPTLVYTPSPKKKKGKDYSKKCYKF